MILCLDESTKGSREIQVSPVGTSSGFHLDAVGLRPAPTFRDPPENLIGSHRGTLEESGIAQSTRLRSRCNAASTSGDELVVQVSRTSSATASAESIEVNFTGSSETTNLPLRIVLCGDTPHEGCDEPR